MHTSFGKSTCVVSSGIRSKPRHMEGSRQASAGREAATSTTDCSENTKKDSTAYIWKGRECNTVTEMVSSNGTESQARAPTTVWVAGYPGYCFNYHNHPASNLVDLKSHSSFPLPPWSSACSGKWSLVLKECVHLTGRVLISDSHAARAKLNKLHGKPSCDLCLGHCEENILIKI